jgi:glutamyl-tRNA synthetase
VTISALADLGVPVATVVGWIATSLGLAEPGEAVSLGQLVARFEVSAIPRAAVTAPQLEAPGH